MVYNSVRSAYDSSGFTSLTPQKEKKDGMVKRRRGSMQDELLLPFTLEDKAGFCLLPFR